MKFISRSKEQSLVIGETIRVEILDSSRERVRLGVEVPAGIEVWAEESWERGTGRRRDLVCWHRSPRQLARQIIEHFQCDPEDVRPIGCGLAYFGHDPCLFGAMYEFVQGFCCAESVCVSPNSPEGSTAAGNGSGHPQGGPEAQST